jgi:NAD(P)-dependent dehydrogenase (short-subunit alcohol dehydrogenase family)
VSPTFDTNALQGRCGIVTGAASGIGRATVETLVAAGADVVVADLDDAGGEETVELAEAGGGGSATFAAVDVADVDSAEELVATAVRRHGKLDFAHNNAGVVFAGSPLHEVSSKDWNRLIAVDLTGVFNCMRAEIGAMLESGGGSIVNTASGVGIVGLPGQGPYVAAKHGVIGLTRVAALDYAKQGIRVNAVCPGSIETPLFDEAAAADPGLRALIEAGHPVGRLGRSTEIADAVVWLVSDASSFVTGQPIVVDGGYTAQ